MSEPVYCDACVAALEPKQQSFSVKEMHDYDHSLCAHCYDKIGRNFLSKVIRRAVENDRIARDSDKQNPDDHEDGTTACQCGHCKVRPGAWVRCCTEIMHSTIACGAPGEVVRIPKR